MSVVASLLEAQTTALLRRLAREQETRTRRLRDVGDVFSLSEASFEGLRTQLRSVYQNMAANPEQTFQDSLQAVLTQRHPRARRSTCRAPRAPRRSTRSSPRRRPG